VTINRLLAHYVSVKEVHAPMSPSLAEKVVHLRRVFGELPAGTPGSELAAIASKAWAGRSPGTIKRYLVQLRAVMTRCFRDGLIQRQPVIDVPYVHDTVYIDISTDELKSLISYIKWVEPKWYPLVLILSHTGARLSEAIAVTPASFTKHGTRIAKPVNRRSKTIDRVIPYSHTLREEVAAGAIFRTGIVPSGIAIGSVSTCLGRVIDDATKALGLPPLRVHDLRHAFASVLAEQGADIADLASALGHSSTAMSMRYRGLVKSRLTGIIAQL